MQSKARRSATRTAIALVAAPILLGGCGDGSGGYGGGSGTDKHSSASGAGKAGAKITVTETEFRLTPANPTIASGTVAINAANRGEIEHSLAVEGPAGKAELAAPLAPGNSGGFQVDLSEPGRYFWYCPIGDHRERGMEGEITAE